MSKAYIEQGLPHRWTEGRVAAAIRSSSTNVAVARKDAVLLGFGIMEYSDLEALLLLLAVHPDGRRKGLGSAIVEWLERVARTAGIARIFVEARSDNEAALSLYRKRGYEQTALALGMYSGMDDGICLEKTFSGGLRDRPDDASSPHRDSA